MPFTASATFRDSLPYILPLLIIFLIIGVYSFRKRRNERKLARNALQASEQNLRLILNSTGEAVYGTDLEGNCTFCNAVSLKILGYSHQDQLIGKDIHSLIHHTTPAGAPCPLDACHIYKTIKMGKPLRLDDELLWRSDGTSFQAEIRSYPLLQEAETIGAVVSFSDITGRKRIETALKENERLLHETQNYARMEHFFREALDHVPSCISIKDLDSRYVYANKSTLKLFGCSAEELEGCDDSSFFPPDVAAWLHEVDSRVLEGEETSEEIEVSDAENGWRIYFEVKSPLYVQTEGKTICGLLGITTDITDSKRAEEERVELEQKFRQTQKLESLGVLAGGIAHDFNNILAIIMGYCSLTEMDYSTAENNMPEIKKATERAAGLCRQMFAYAGKAQLNKSQVDIAMLTNEMLEMLRPTLSRNATLKSSISDDIPVMYADAGQLRQIVMNLVVNASEAIGREHGEIRVTLSRTTISGGKSGRDYHGKIIPAGGYVCLEVTDNGCGMDEETKWRIFEPFFTTKFAGRGLGMAAVLGIIKTHDGAMQLFSQPGQGTTFKVFLPLSAGDSTFDEYKAPPVPAVRWQGSGTILLVEDEEQLRIIAKTMLNKFGFTVLDAANGREALELYHKNRAAITLVLTDLGMPVMDGCELFHKLKILNPELPIIISSGFGDVEVSSRIARDDIAGLISKPYDPDQFLDVLKACSPLSPPFPP